MIDNLKRSEFFLGFDDQALAAIVRFARMETYEAGKVVFDRDEEAHTAYIILKGRVRQGFEVSPGTEVWFLTGEPGDLFGFGSMLSPRVRSMRAKASEKCEVVAIDADAQMVRACNSWGPDWGDHGYFQFSWDTWDRLLQERGDVTTVTTA